MRGIFVLLFGLWSAAVASNAVAETLNVEHQALMMKIDSHLNRQKTMQSRFVQLDGLGGIQEGTLYWQRPDQARFAYDLPSPLLLIASGNFLIEVDRELEQVSHYPQGGTIADYLLGENVLQNPKLEVLRLERRAGLIDIAMRERASPENGEIILQFDERSLNLRRWEIVTPEGETSVTLIDPRYNLELGADLFHFHAPREWTVQR